jgi:hypothetical protein
MSSVIDLKKIDEATENEKKLLIKKLIIQVFDYLEKVEPNFEKPMIFISGADIGDAHDTFEPASNLLLLGSASKSKLVGYTLLYFLRMIYDNHDYEFIIDTLDLLQERISVKLEDVIDIMKENKDHIQVFDPDKELNSTLTDRQGEKFLIVRNVEDVNVWGFDQIKNRILNNFERWL